jgi:Protein of unknown function (DUF3048) N-terminal domain/Protein of unknown function (DUF3048) C-terminal domain
MWVILAVAVVGIVVGIIVSRNGTTPDVPGLASDVCPLTGLPAPGGSVPRRPALLVKIGNEPSGARPQSGLNEADVVYDTPAEGFIMRYMAVYQCHDATSIGPTRSLRWVDYHLAGQFSSPILAYAGGIIPNLDAATSLSWIHPANLLGSAASSGTRISSRVPPDNLYTSTSALYGLFPNLTTQPQPVFSYSSSAPAAARPATSVRINFSGGTDVVWNWDSAVGDWVHSYTTGADVDADTGRPVTATNIVIQVVSSTIGPYIESPGGTGDIESQTVGSGRGWVVRDSKAVAVTWHRAGLMDPTTFSDARGQRVSLAPGRTWVELVPNAVANSPGGLTITG